MQRKTITLFLILAGIFLQASAQQFHSAADYNNYIVEEQSRIIKENLEYISKSVHSNNATRIESRRLEVLKQIDKSLEKIKRMPDFEGNVDFRNEVLVGMQLFRQAYESRYKEASDLYPTREQSYEAMERYYALQDSAESEIKSANERIQIAQKEFAAKNNIKLVSDDKKNKIFANISLVNKYTHDIFLIYFRVSKSNASFHDAFSTKNSQLMDEKRIQLSTDAQNALEKLTKLKSLNNESQYKLKAQKLIEFYKTIANKDYKDFVTILDKEEKTKADVDKFNRSVDLINTKSNLLFKEFQEAQITLMRKYIPEM